MDDEMQVVAARIMPIADRRPNPTNVRSHPDDQVAQIAASIHEFGFTNPILADTEAGGIVAGHGRGLAVLRPIETAEAIRLP